MNCKVTKTTINTECGDVNGIRYCKEVKVKEKICVPKGKDAAIRLYDVLSGLNKGWGRFLDSSK